jgi:Spy/CpxP family protein refolding chaperone
MKIKVGLLMVAAVSCLLIISVVYAQEVKKVENKGVPVVTQQNDRIFDQLNLTPDQKQKLQTNKQAQFQEMQTVSGSLREKNRSLQEALRNPVTTRASVLGIANEVKELQAKLVDLKIDGVFLVKEILTPEQYVKFQQLMEARPGKMPMAGKKYEHHGEPARIMPNK